MMKRIFLLFTATLISGCVSTVNISPGGKYAAPLGGFVCGPYYLAVRVQESLRPNGGTIHLVGEVNATRIDIERFDPAIEDKAVLAEQRAKLYEGYLNQSILPLVTAGAPASTLVGSEAVIVKGRAVYRSAVLIPGGSAMVAPGGKRIDGIRGQVQYTNGRYMYTVSRISMAFPHMSREAQVGEAYAAASGAYENCEFPE